jgi:methionine-rich copper-binding protein CopC
MRIARLVTAAVAATALLVFSGGAPAWAHNALTKAVPAKNATVKESPEKVELTFLDSLDDTFTIEVADAQGQKVPTGKASVDGKKGTAAITGTLAGGTYTVTYRLVADDGDPIKGSYKFTVDTAAPSTAPSPSASPDPVVSSSAPASTPATVAASETSGGDTNWALIISIAVAVVVLATGALLLGRRRKNP